MDFSNSKLGKTTPSFQVRDCTITIVSDLELLRMWNKVLHQVSQPFLTILTYSSLLKKFSSQPYLIPNSCIIECDAEERNVPLRRAKQAKELSNR